MDKYSKVKIDNYDPNSTGGRFNRILLNDRQNISNIGATSYNIINHTPYLINKSSGTEKIINSNGIPTDNKNLLSRLSGLSSSAKNSGLSGGTKSTNSTIINNNTNNNNSLSYNKNNDNTQTNQNISTILKSKSQWEKETYYPYSLYNKDKENKENKEESFNESKNYINNNYNSLLNTNNSQQLLNRDKSIGNINNDIKSIASLNNLNITSQPRSNNLLNSNKNNSKDGLNANNLNKVSAANNIINENNSIINNKSLSYQNNIPTRILTTVDNLTKNSINSVTLANKQVGLDNLGNTCFMNTSLQCLIHSEPFMRRFQQEKDRVLGSTSTRATPTSRAIYDLCIDICQKNDTLRASISPSAFKSVFGSAHRMFSGYSQHDTQEFLRVLLDDISLELNRVINIPEYRELDARVNDKVKLNYEFDRLIKAREDSIVTDTFSTQIVNIFTCIECNYETYSFEKYMDIPLLLEGESYGLTLSKLLDGFFASDKIKWESPCENSKCKKKSYHTKNIKFGYTPEILLLSFQRNNGRARRKNTASISFEEKIDVSKYVDRDCIGLNSTRYSLYAVSFHSGSLDFGHYFSFVKIKGDWYEFNDSLVTRCNSFSYSSSNVYVLFYKRDDV